jgi:RHS repeat-associated protein
MGEKFAANPVTGTGSMTVPIAASPGRGGFGPQLSLSYDSGAGNGPFGLGWSLGIPAIRRKTDRGLPQYLDAAESDTFLLAGAEDLVPVLSASGELPAEETVRVYSRNYRIRRYRPRIEGLFARIERWTAADDPAQMFWRTISRDNITSWYGRSDASRVRDPEDPARSFEWLLCETHDDKGNAAVYRYLVEDGAGVDRRALPEANRPAHSREAASYLTSIVYGNRTPFLPSLAAAGTTWVEPPSDANAWMFELRFDYGDIANLTTEQPDSIHPELGPRGRWSVRTDPFSSHRAGFEVRTWRLCRRVLMLHHFPDQPEVGPHCLVKSTDFRYEQPSAAALADPEQPGYTVLRAVVQRSYQRRPATSPGASAPPGYAWRALPPLTFTYSQPRVDTTLRRIAAADLPNLPVGTQGAGYQWVDLDGEGLSGVLSEQGGAWHYAANRGDGRFGPSRVVAPVPAMAALAGGRQQLMDLAGDGAIELVEFGGPTPGFHERTSEGGWTRHVPFRSLPSIDWQDPNLRFVDLTGDGHADALISEQEVFTWYPSLEERGFAPALRQRQAADEESGPRLVFNDGSQTIFLADMSGDGLTDLVRIRNGEVCWWPNLGYGMFGRKVSLANAPRFDAPDQFDPARLRLADIDGSGPTDLIYLGRGGAQLYLNRSGNSFSNGRLVPLPLATANLAAVQVADLLGIGTACLVWNSHLPADASHPVRYIDLMADGKPHLLTRVVNNLGGSTEIDYTPSTRFYLDDMAAGRPWATRLPFPVHCVSRVTVADRHRRTRFSTSTTYHHGHFDGEEREFRGFGRVERLDVERFLPGPNVSDDQALVQPPVKTVSWFHTGLADDRQRILGLFEGEFFPARQPGRFVPDGFRERVLPQPEVETSGGPPLDGPEWREAMRACKGMLLREEVFELDLAALERGEHRPVRLFSAAHHNCLIRRLQPRGVNAHAVFLALESEALTYHYELDLRQANASADPRVAHSLQLRFDAYGRPEQSVAVVYPRAAEHVDDALPADQLALIRQVQREQHLAYSETRFSDEIPPGLGHHRLPAVVEALTYELTGFRPSTGRHFTPGDLRPYRLSDRLADQGPTPVASPPYQDTPAAGAPARRLVERVVTLYARDDLSGPLPLGQQGRLGIEHETYKLALTESLLGDVLGARFDAASRDALNRPSTSVWPNAAAGFLASGYRKGDQVLGAPTAEEQWWLRSGVAGYDTDAAQRFYLPTRYRDPFGHLTSLSYGADDLYIASSTDAAGNRTVVTGFDHRVLAPTRLRDASGNESAMAYDIRGLPVATALRGKVSADGVAESGDDVTSLSFEQLNPSEQAVAAFFLNAALDGRQARQWLGKATSRFVYHFGIPLTAGGPTTAPGACSLQRERHERDRTNQPSADPASWIPLQMAFAYSDGSGQPLVSKAQAEPDPADPSAALRWIANGKTVLNNKGKPVKQYEPYFSSVGHRFEEPREEGVATTFTYDAPGRLVRTDFPDGTLARVVFSPWWSQAWDASDTVEESRWVLSRNSLDPAAALAVGVNGLVIADPEQRAGWLAIRHTETPAQTHRDSLGREVIAIAHNRVEDPSGKWKFGGSSWRDDFQLTFTRLDAEGKPLWIRDARGNRVMQYITAAQKPCYDLAGNLLAQRSMDAGDRWMLPDGAGQPLRAWDGNERQSDAGQWFDERRLYRSDYDVLHRPTAQWLEVERRPMPTSPAMPTGPFTAEPVLQLERLEYQDGVADDRDNLNGQLVRHYDPSGLMETVRRSFAGAVEVVRRTLARDGRASAIDWSGNPQSQLESTSYTRISEHDALGRMTRLFNWHRAAADGSASRVAVYLPSYNARGALAGERLLLRAGIRRNAQGRIEVTPDASSQRDVNAIVAVAYNARGQKTSLRLGNGTETRFSYDPQTFRLTGLTTQAGGRRLQNLSYVYDAAGNITHIRDAAQQTVFFNNAVVEPSCDYSYDALGRLTEASGREQAGAPVPSTPEGPWPVAPVPTNGTLRRHTQRYVYDVVGNVVRMEHRASGGDWIRHYRTATDSNRLLQTRMGNGDWATPDPPNDTLYRYDSHGSMLNLANSPGALDLRWDHRDMIRAINLGGGGFAWYQYDGGKQRTRKLINRRPAAGAADRTVKEERIDLGGLELYRRYTDDANEPVEEIESHHLFEGEQRVLLVDDVLQAREPNKPGPNGLRVLEQTLLRYQYGNHLASVGLELDHQARLISYEEFHPYGTSAYRFMNNDPTLRAPEKRYRYTGMERDEESGLSYHTARYYLPSLGRWGSSDPSGPTDGVNVYCFVQCNPILNIDTNGREARKSAAQYRKEAEFFYSQGWMDEYREYAALAHEAGVKEGLEEAKRLTAEQQKTTTLAMGSIIAIGLTPMAIGLGIEAGAASAAMAAFRVRELTIAIHHTQRSLMAAFRVRALTIAIHHTQRSLLGVSRYHAQSLAAAASSGGFAGSASAVSSTTAASSGALIAAAPAVASIGPAAKAVGVVTAASLILNSRDPLGLNREASAQPQGDEQTTYDSDRLAQLQDAAFTALVEGDELSHGLGTIHVGVVRDASGRSFVLGVVTGQDPGIGGVRVSGEDIAVDLEVMVEELGLEAEFYSGLQQTDLHAERVYERILDAYGYTQVGPSYSNRAPCSAGCAHAQSNINTTIIDLRPND